MSPRLRISAALAATALLTTLTACGGNSANTPQAQGSPGTPGSATTATAAPSPGSDPSKGNSTTAQPSDNASPTPGTPVISTNPKTGKRTYCGPGQKPFTGPAADKFGADNVMAGYCEAVKALSDYAYVPNLLRQSSGFRAVEFSQPRIYMDQSVLKDYDGAVQKVATTSIADLSDPVRYKVWAFQYFALDRYDNHIRLYPASSPEPTVLNQSFSPAVAAVDNQTSEPRLDLTFTVGADLVMTDGKVPYRVNVHKRCDLLLVKNGSRTDIPWLIDAYTCNFGFHPPVKDTSLEIAGAN